MVIGTDLDLSDLYGSALERTFGFNPAYGSIKPVHIANGISRRIIGMTYDTLALNRLLRWDHQRNQPNLIVQDYGDSLSPNDIVREVDRGRLENLRMLLRKLFAADGAVFPSDARGQDRLSSYTLSNRSFVTGDPSDRGVGNLLVKALEINGSQGVIDAIRTWLDDTHDPWTTLAQPFLKLSTGRRYTSEHDGTISDAIEDSDGNLSSKNLRKFCDAMECLVAFENQHLDKLNSLRRLVTLSCFCCYLFLARRGSELRTGNEFAAEPPVFLDLLAGRVDSINAASHASYKGALQAAEQVIKRSLTGPIRTILGSDSITDNDAMSFIGSMRLPTRGRTADRLQQDRNRYLSRYQSLQAGGGYSVFESLVRATTESAFESLASTPMAFMREIGRRTGFLAPWSTRAESKRYSISNEFLEVLVISTIRVGERLEFPEFLELLREKFGIVTGTTDEIDIIRCNNLSQQPFGPPINVTENDLRRNYETFRDRLCDIGYATTYADGTTVVLVE
jgi:hypothetical protein